MHLLKYSAASPHLSILPFVPMNILSLVLTHSLTLGLVAWLGSVWPAKRHIRLSGNEKKERVKRKKLRTYTREKQERKILHGLAAIHRLNDITVAILSGLISDL